MRVGSAGHAGESPVPSTIGLRDGVQDRNAADKRHRWIPTLSLSIGSFDERLRVRVDGTDYDSYRGQLRTVLAVGLAHPVIARLKDDRVSIDGLVSLGVGPTFYTGHWQLPVREDLTFAFATTRWLTLRAGLGAGLTLDTSAGRRSFAELALPIGLTFFHTIELVYRPMLSLPLGSETSPVFGGERAISTRLAVLPFELLLRVRIGALGWQ
jgi:hypothetical protein